MANIIDVDGTGDKIDLDNLFVIATYNVVASLGGGSSLASGGSTSTTLNLWSSSMSGIWNTVLSDDITHIGLQPVPNFQLYETLDTHFDYKSLDNYTEGLTTSIFEYKSGYSCTRSVEVQSNTLLRLELTLTLNKTSDYHELVMKITNLGGRYNAFSYNLGAQITFYTSK